MSRSTLRLPAAVLFIAMVLPLLAGSLTAPAAGYRVNASAWQSDGLQLSSVTMPDGIVVSTSTTGYVFAPGASIDYNNPTPSMFTPSMANSTPRALLDIFTVDCPADGDCGGVGTFTIAFSSAVLDPVLHVSGLGVVHANGDVSAVSTVRPVLTLTSSVPVGAALGPASAGATNLQVVGGDTITGNLDGAGRCDSTFAPVGPSGYQAAATAGCGSVAVDGLVSSLTFEVGAVSSARVGGGLASTFDNSAEDLVDVAVTYDEDLGDAPASYDQGNPASNAIGSLRIGNTLDADSLGVANPSANPNAVADGAGANGDNGDGADEDAFATDPPPLQLSGLGDDSYPLSVPITGAETSGTLCGWLDYDQDGSFDDAGERDCAGFEAGSSTVPLTIAATQPPAGGTTYLRLRAVDSPGEISATGPLGPGEVEDYSVALLPAPFAALTVDASVEGQTDANENGLLDAGDQLDYTFLVTNTGNLTVSSVGVDDTLAGPVSCPAPTLLQSESTTCTASYTVAQADVDAGSVDTAATATVKTPTVRW